MPMVAAMGSVALPRSLQTPSSSALRASRAAARRSSRPVSLPCSASAQPPPKKQPSALMRGVWQLAALAVPAREAAPVEQRPKRGSASPRRERGAEKLQFRTIFISDLHLVCAPARMQLRRRARSCCAARKLRLFSWTFGRARARRGARLLRGAARLHLCARRPRPRALWVLRCVASADAPVRALCVPGHGRMPGSGSSGLSPRNRVRNHVPRGRRGRPLGEQQRPRLLAAGAGVRARFAFVSRGTRALMHLSRSAGALRRHPEAAQEGPQRHQECVLATAERALPSCSSLSGALMCLPAPARSRDHAWKPRRSAARLPARPRDGVGREHVR